MKSKSPHATDVFWQNLPPSFKPPANFQIPSQQFKPTPLQKFQQVWLKREDQSPTGSHKFRALVFQLSKLTAAQTPAAVLSSTGNAAIAATFYPAPIKIFLLLSPQTPPGKLAALKVDNHFRIPILSTRPIRLTKYLAAHFHLPDLRPSQDPHAAQGFQTLGFELFHQNPNLRNIFSYCTSGASLAGLAAAYQKLAKIRFFGVCLDSEPPQLATQICRPSGGQVVKISAPEFLASRQKILTSLQAQQITPTSQEGLISLFAAQKIQPPGATAVIFTGQEFPAQTVPQKFLRADDFGAIEKIYAQDTAA